MIIRLFVLFKLLLFVSGTGMAQSSDEEIRYYDVEVIIFKNTRGPKGKELILPVSSPRKQEPLLDLSSPDSIKAAAKESYEVLKPEQMRLNERVEKIEKSPYYELLAHVGWRQPGVEKEKAIPVWIRAGRQFDEDYVTIDTHLINLANSASNEFADNSSGFDSDQTTDTPPSTEYPIYELEGKITIALARYLHTYTDLVLRRPKLSLDEILENPEQTRASQDIADAYILDNYNLNEHRRMRSKSLHYLDNPEFSMLILITPYEPEATSTAVTQ